MENPFAENEGSASLAGSYSWLDVSDATVELFLGEKDLIYGEDEDKVALLGCICGCDGCWPFAAKIRLFKEHVVWSNFEQPHRTDPPVQTPWDYGDFGPLIFNRERYFKEIGKIQAAQI